MEYKFVAPFAACLLIATSAAWAQSIQNITVIPALPQPSDLISVRIGGILPDPCHPDPSIQTAISGNSIVITLSSTSSAEACIGSLGGFSVTTNIGALPVGNYTISATLYADNRLLGSPATQSFSVVSGAPPTPAPPSLILALTGLVGTALYLARRWWAPMISRVP